MMDLNSMIISMVRRKSPYTRAKVCTLGWSATLPAVCDPVKDALSHDPVMSGVDCTQKFLVTCFYLSSQGKYINSGLLYKNVNIY